MLTVTSAHSKSQAAAWVMKSALRHHGGLAWCGCSRCSSMPAPTLLWRTSWNCHSRCLALLSEVKDCLQRERGNEWKNEGLASMRKKLAALAKTRWWCLWKAQRPGRLLTHHKFGWLNTGEETKRTKTKKQKTRLFFTNILFTARILTFPSR